MSANSSNVLRQSIRVSPTSNTEVNTARLPDPKSLDGMELRYREESPNINSASPVAFSLWMAACGVYAMVWKQAPYVGEWLWREAHNVEGMPVVGAMLAGMVFLIAVFSVVLVPKEVRLALLAISLPIAFLTMLNWAGYGPQTFLVGMFVTPFALISWRRSLNRFHDSWLSADPRMTTAQATAWQGSKKHGWALPTQRRGSASTLGFHRNGYDHRPSRPRIHRRDGL